MSNNPHRTLPHNLSAEASVLGGIIVRNERLAQLDELEVDDFYGHKHRVVFAAMRTLEAKKRPLDVVTLEVEIERQGKLEAIGGVGFLGELALNVPTADNVVAYAAIVRDKRRVRDMMLAAQELVELGYQVGGQPGLEAEELLGKALASLAAIDRHRSGQSHLIGEMVRDRVAEIEKLSAAKARGEIALIGVPTGIASLDAHIGGYPLGDVSLLAARPAMGKTSMAMAAVDAASAAGYGAHVFSQEGGWRMYADRCISRSTGIPVERLRNGKLEREDGLAIATALGNYNRRLNWRVDARAGLTASEIIRNVRKWRTELKTKLVVVDYVQIIKRTKGLSENEALDEIITAFSHAALEDDIAYLVLAQLNREVEKRTDKRPQSSDLRGSGALEERPRVIVSPYRGSTYYADPKKGIDYDCDCLEGAPCTHEPTREEFERLVKVLVLKNNNGSTGYVDATWRPETTEMW